MKRARFSEEQIIAVLKEAEAGAKVAAAYLAQGCPRTHRGKPRDSLTPVTPPSVPSPARYHACVLNQARNGASPPPRRAATRLHCAAVAGWLNGWLLGPPCMTSV